MTAVPASELDTVLGLVAALDARVVNVGHGRDPGSVVRAAAFTRAWPDRGGEVGRVVSWPTTAASWLRPARRLAADADAWVIADGPGGWGGIGPRLVGTAGWRADRTIAFAGLGDPGLARAAGPGATHGLRGATDDGRVWRIEHGWLRTDGDVRWTG